MIQKIQKFVDGYGIGMSKEQLADKVYRFLDREHDVCLINERYISVDGEEFQFIKSKAQSRWIVNQYR